MRRNTGSKGADPQQSGLVTSFPLHFDKRNAIFL